MTVERFVVVLVTPAEQIRVFSTPEPMDLPAGRRFLRELKRTVQRELRDSLHLRRVVELTPGQPFSKEPELVGCVGCVTYGGLVVVWEPGCPVHRRVD